MSLNTAATLAAIESHAMGLGRFEKVNTHEPKSRPASGGLFCAIWADEIRPMPRASGLAVTAARVAWNIRIYTNMLQDPQDGIDPAVIEATDLLFTAYAGDFTLGGAVMAVDLLGAAGGVGLTARAGYITIDNTKYRCMTIILPILVSDAWEQVA